MNKRNGLWPLVLNRVRYRTNDRVRVRADITTEDNVLRVIRQLWPSQGLLMYRAADSVMVKINE